MQRGHPINRMASLAIGSGGGIRTPDLWVMSPTSCRCSTPRRTGTAVLVRSSFSLPLVPRVCVSRGSGAPAAASPPVGSPPQYSPALHWVTTGFGMGPGGASALSATGAPDPPHGGPAAQRVSRVTSSLLLPGSAPAEGLIPPPAARPPRSRLRRPGQCGGSQPGVCGRWVGGGICGHRGAVPVVVG